MPCCCNMAKATYVFLFIVAAIFGCIQADNDDQNTKPEFNLGRTIHGCIAKFNVTDEQMTAVMKTGDARAITPCFWSCCFKGAGVLNSDGEYDLDATLDLGKNMLVYSIYIKAEEIAKKCGSVNDESVIIGDTGCERGILLANCMIENGKKLFPKMFHSD
ncbi:uncharacterized protein LOC118267983 [Spodoptera frugiperda]|uniref:Uncharacterized protein LOC118267983 n=1 Tax=Spodoptera frugiperda TaxID=7108 RepID=A0A9R0EVU2_SPOFR|nr:uncharacterized protein LOC118267983 [Spodoptera frugiperda]